jgi:hypothetical protein
VRSGIIKGPQFASHPLRRTTFVNEELRRSTSGTFDEEWQAADTNLEATGSSVGGVAKDGDGMNDLYLILHKVRGEPTFDIAQRACQGSPCQPNCGLWNGETCSAAEDWIIPTSGHVAHPWWSAPLNNAVDWEMQRINGNPLPPIDEIPNDIPDHYQPSTSPKEDRASGTSLLAALGLPTKVHSSVSGKLTRRI